MSVRVMQLQRFFLLLAMMPALAVAQGVPTPTGELRAVEVDVQASDGGTAVSSDDATRLGLSTDGGEAKLEPPSLVAESPAAWPEGLEGTPGEVSLELLVDEHGAVADVKVLQAPAEPRLTEAALKAAPRPGASPRPPWAAR
ncbi:energy transducer TonB, partial [Pyxidicoccus sp. 3LG]